MLVAFFHEIGLGWRKASLYQLFFSWKKLGDVDLVINTSHNIFSTAEMEVLSFGLKFATGVKNHDMEKLIDMNYRHYDSDSHTNCTRHNHCFYYVYIYIYIYIFMSIDMCIYIYRPIGVMVSMCSNGKGDQGSIPGRVILKTKNNGT